MQYERELLTIQNTRHYRSLLKIVRNVSSMTAADVFARQMQTIRSGPITKSPLAGRLRAVHVGRRQKSRPDSGLAKRNTMSRKKLSRRDSCYDSAASTTLITAPYYTAPMQPANFRSVSRTTQPRADKASTDLVNNGPPRRRSRLGSTTSDQGDAAAADDASRSSRPDPVMNLCRSRHRSARACRPRPCDEVVEAIIKQSGDVNGTVKYLGVANGRSAGGPGLRRQPDQGALLAHRPDEETRRHRCSGDVDPAGEAPKADAWTTDAFPEGHRSLPQGRQSLRHRPW